MQIQMTVGGQRYSFFEDREFSNGHVLLEIMHVASYFIQMNSKTLEPLIIINDAKTTYPLVKPFGNQCSQLLIFSHLAFSNTWQATHSEMVFEAFN